MSRRGAGTRSSKRLSTREEPKGEEPPKITRSEAILKEFDIEVDSRVREMKSMYEELKLKMKNNLELQLMRLPKNIRQMNVNEFISTYKADINQVAKSTALKRTQEREAKISASSKITALSKATKPSDKAAKIAELQKQIAMIQMGLDTSGD